MITNAIQISTSNNFFDLNELGGFGANLPILLPRPIQGIYIGVTTDLTLIDGNNKTKVFKNCQAGSVLPLSPKTIDSASIATDTEIILLL